ncbi:hypothetical protein [Phycicoccus sp.]|uniref:hypothetical protein n=1 Tax=Phycicoccus sp. TaxID=1902410 RepID=UPI002D0CAED8|nr:hypothetical protein [Phycicoccus sp.]HMM95413.1 hypothetical protein [Phycicoccus sp.]
MNRISSRVDPRRGWLAIAVAAALIAVGIVAGLGYKVVVLSDAVNEQKSTTSKETQARVEADADRRELAERLDDAVSDVNALRNQVLANGERPVVEAPSRAATPLSDAEVRAVALQVVRTYAVDSNAVNAIVSAAVAKVEKTPGPKGDGPTQDEVLDAVQSVVIPYLAANPPKDGVNGKDGADGAPGAPGVGIKSVTFDDTRCLIVTTLTDGSTQELGPVCGKDAYPVTIRFNFDLDRRTTVLVTCEIKDNSAPTDCTSEQVRKKPTPTPTPTTSNTTTTS